eukprot:UN10483
MGRNRPAQGARYEAHFNLQPDNKKEAGCSQDVRGAPSNNKEFHISRDSMDTENMMTEYAECSGTLTSQLSNKIQAPVNDFVYTMPQVCRLLSFLERFSL